MTADGPRQLDRRTLLRVAGLGGLAVALAPLLSSCVSSKEIDVLTSSLGRRPAAPLTASSFGPFSARLADAVAPSGNVVLSGYSIAVVLAMIANGAAGPTKEEFVDVLGGPVPGLNEQVNSVSQAITAAGQKVSVTIANAFWAQQGYAWKQAFLDILAGYYGAGVHQVDFARPDAVVAAMNAWANDQTHGLIPEIVTSDQITTDTRMALANAIHFKGSWAEQFDPAATVTQAFTTGSGRTVQVPMMGREALVPWLETDTWQAVSLPFEGDEWAMVLALPKPGVPASLVSLTSGGGFEEVTSAQPVSVRLQVPRWKAASDLDLKAPLQALGLALAFDPADADFTQMTEQERLFLGFVLHKARINVDETGAEAAAVTVGGMAATSLPVDQRLLILDRPFGYALVHLPSRTQLFLGRVDDPTTPN